MIIYRELPICLPRSTSLTANPSPPAIKGLFGCPHDRAHELFIATLTEQSCPFVSFPCKDYAEYESGDCQRLDQATIGRMGMDADKYNLSGNYYLQTTSDKNAFCSELHQSRRYSLEENKRFEPKSRLGYICINPTSHLYLAPNYAGTTVEHVLLNFLLLGWLFSLIT